MPEQPEDSIQQFITTRTRYVWFDTVEKKYWFEDETSNFNGPINTEDGAAIALMSYVNRL